MSKKLRKILSIEPVETYETQVNIDYNVKGWTPLHYAAARGKPETVELLLNAGADPNAKNEIGQTPMHMAVQNWAGGKVLDMLINAGANLWARDNAGHDIQYYINPRRRWELANELFKGSLYKNNRAIGLTIACNDRKLREMLKADLEQKFMDQALFFASCPKIARLLIKYGANVNARDESGAVPLHYIKDAQTASVLIKKGADVNVRDNNGQTPLHFAADGEMVRLLLENGAEINAKDKDGFAPLDVCGNIDAASELVMAGTELEFIDSRRAIKDIHIEEELGFFQVYRMEIRESANEELLDDKRAAEAECEDLIINLIYGTFFPPYSPEHTLESLEANGLDLTIKIDGNPLTEIAKEWGASEEIIQTLKELSEPIPPEELAELEERYQRVNDCFKLIEHLMDDDVDRSYVRFVMTDIDLERRYKNGDTIFHVLVRYFDPEVFEELDLYDPDRFRDSSGGTPLHELMWEERRLTEENEGEDWWNDAAVEIAKIFLESECDPNARNNFGNTPLFFAGSVKTARALVEFEDIDRRADVNATNKRGDTSLFYAWTPEIAEYLIEKGADVNHVNNLGNTPLMVVRDDRIREVLLKAGADPNKGGEPYNFSPLHNTEDPEEALELIQNGADVHARSEVGDTPLHIAIFWDRLDVARVLLEHGADVNSRTA